MANIYDKKERERMDKFLNNPKTKDMTFKEYEKTKKNPPRAKRRRVANFPERSNRGLGLSSMEDALDRLSIFPPNEKELAKRKQARDDEKKVDKSIKRQIAKTERDAEKKVNRLEKEREKRIMGGGRSGGGGGGGFGALNLLNKGLPGRRKMRKGGIVKTKTKTRKFKGDGIAKRGKTKGRFI